MRAWRATFAVAATLTLAACSASTPVIEYSTAERLQQSVLAVSTAAHGNDLAGATTALDQVAEELEAAKVRGEVTEDRYLRIMAAIDAVRAFLHEATAPAPAPAPAPAEEPAGEGSEEAPEEQPPPPADDDDGDDTEGDDGQDAEQPDEGDDGSAPTPTPAPSTPKTTPTPTTTKAPASGTGAVAPAPTT